MQFKEEEITGPNDLNDHRIFLIENNKIHFKRRDPYSFWYINLDKGPVPKSLDSAYTSFDEAKKAVIAFLKSRNKPILEEIL